METPVLNNKKGFTLIEFSVAILILMVGLLGLLQTVNFALSHNMTNQLRQEALALGDEILRIETSKNFDLIVIGTVNSTHQRFVNGARYTYNATVTSSNLTEKAITVDTQLQWNYKGHAYRHSISSIVSKN